MEELLLTIDIGTTAIKYDIHGLSHIIFSHSSRLTTFHQKEYAIQHPEEIIRILDQDMKMISHQYPMIREISLSTAMHTVIPYEEENTHEMLLWSDNRATDVIAQFKKDREMSSAFYRKTGTPIHPMSPFAKLLYFKTHHVEWYERVSFWGDLKSFVLDYFTNQLYIDYSTASATGLFNSCSLDWDSDILHFLQISRAQLPKLAHPKESFSISKKTADRLGFNQDVKVRIGASDGCLVALGSFKSTGSPVSLTLGTSGAVRILASQRHLSSTEATFCYYLEEDKWVIGGPSNNGGKVLEWASELLYDDKVKIYGNLNRLIKDDHLLFLPYLQGERAPFWDSSQRAGFYNLSIEHQKPHITQAVIEGVIFNLLYIYKQLGMSGDQNEIVLSGGVFKNKTIAQMTATIFNKVCISSQNVEPSQGLRQWWSQRETTQDNNLTYFPIESERTYYQTKYHQFCLIINKIMDGKTLHF